MVLDLDRVLLQRGGELDAAARDPGVRGLGLQHRVSGNDLGGFQDLSVIGDDKAGVDRRPRPGPALEQAALDQQHVDALAAQILAVAWLGQFQPDFLTASRTHASNEVRSCQISAGAVCGTTSAQPCNSRAWIIIRLSG